MVAPEDTVVDKEEIAVPEAGLGDDGFASINGSGDAGDKAWIFELEAVVGIGPIGDLADVEVRIEEAGDFGEGDFN